VAADRVGWLRWQPNSALTHWFLRRFGAAGGPSKRIGIVALARKLAIALWRYVEHGSSPRAPRSRHNIFVAPPRVHSLVRAARDRSGFPTEEPFDRWRRLAPSVRRMIAAGVSPLITAVTTDRRSSGRGSTPHGPASVEPHATRACAGADSRRRLRGLLGS
jgi:hypothetical protein